ncbi:type VII secretion-associated serine protease mycosin [Streptomyces calidiresistens]
MRSGRSRLLVALLTGVLLTGGAPTAAADAIRDQQRWALDFVNAPTAWQTTRGAGVTVAVLDTGVDDSHPDLHGAVLEGTDLVGEGAGPGDPEWARHGTAMAAIIAGRGHGPDAGSGVIGVAPEAMVLPVRVLLEEEDPARAEHRRRDGSTVAEGIRWAVDNGADVINLSLGDDSPTAHPDPEEDAAIRYALANGVVVVASAGNGGEDGDPISYPAGYPGVIAVTAVDRTGARAPFSTRRWYATLGAPGKDVVIAAPGGQYMHGWGTSAAAAFVSGAVALVRAAHPELDPAAVRRLLVETAGGGAGTGRDDDLGAGIVDPAAAIAAANTAEPRLDAEAAGAYPREYFGPGPRPVPGDPLPAPWLAPAAAAVGGVLLVLAALLFRRLRPSGPPHLPPP